MKKNGYVLPTTLMIISVAIALLTSVMHRSFMFQDTTSFELKKQRARLLAFSAIQIAMAQVSLVLPEEKKGESAGQVNPETEKPTAQKTDAKEGEQTQEKLTPTQEWLTQLMPLMNKWQTFKLTDAIDGIEGTLQLYIACEQGKFNITRMYDILNTKASAADKKVDDKKSDATQAPQATKKTWVDVGVELLEKNGIVDFGKALTSFKAAFNRPPEDGTELLTQEAVKAFKTNIFPNPDNKSILKGPIYLMDLFTTATNTEKLNPWLLSSSVATVLGLAAKNEKFSLKEKIKEIKPFTNWPQQWNKLLEPLYGKKFENIAKEITPLFASSFDASVCSVICYAQILGASQKIYAIIEKVAPPEGISPKSVVFKIKRIYWL